MAAKASKWRGSVWLSAGVLVATFTLFEIVITVPGWGGHGGPYMVMGAIMQLAIAIGLITVGIVRRVRPPA